ncbi:hypothetical protein PDIDSM_5231 [Penicillium digitatum]|nr:hypothetical protein PDIDSM_5231 [Penicillium digitatum]
MKIRLNLSSKEYTVSRAILVDQSQYVARVFGGNFTEVKDQPVVMKELDGVLFIQSFEIRLLWLSTGEVNCRNQEPGAKAATLIEFARLADVCDISQVEAQIAEHPRKSINQRITNNGSVNKKGDDESSINNENDPNASTQGFTTEDIRSVINLSIGHQVRSLVAKASVAGFLSKKDYRFAKLAQEVPVFGADLLVQVQATTRGVQYLNNTAIWQKIRCINEASAVAGCVSSVDYKCTCPSPAFKDTLGTCLKVSCTPDDVTVAGELHKARCGGSPPQ